MTIQGVHKVAVVDDNPDDRELLVWAVEEAGFEPVIIDSVPSDIDATVIRLRSVADGLVCDHQLRWGNFAQFDGAELAARCFSARLPTVLVTAFLMDSDASIRVHRRRIPGFVPRAEVDGDSLHRALTMCVDELSDSPHRERVPWPALVRVQRVSVGPDGTVLDVVVPQWNPRLYVRIPLSSLTTGVIVEDPSLLVGRRFLAKVNTAAETEADLYFEDFEDAGEVPSEEELQ